MKAFKGPAKQRGFIPQLIGAGLSLFGSNEGRGNLAQERQDILNLPGQNGPQDLSGNFGNSSNGNFQLDQGLQSNQDNVVAGANNFLQGGNFNNANFQQAFQNNNIAGAAQGADQLLQQQVGNNAFGGSQQNFNNSQGLANQFANTVAQGPQDASGGFQQASFNQGFANQQAAGDQQGLFDSSLASQRAAFAPEAQRQQNAVTDSLFAKGMFGAGSSNTGAAFEGLFNSQGAQDLAFQNNAFDQSMQRGNFLANLGSNQFNQGQNLQNSNQGQFNQNVNNFNSTTGTNQGIEGQQFNQNLQAQGFNNNAGNQRLQNSLNLFNTGDASAQSNFQTGNAGANTGLNFANFGLDAAGRPIDQQANLLQGSGGIANSLAGGGAQQAAANTGFFDGLAGGIMDIFG